ncbi:hypothetical protein TWF679_010990 [Orbilia oligospora]|uniref:Uncharacterized protein n=1 Tax=Orbilia oligospora TaxID=2813651 RepID=A0A8H8VIN7_ORBOL|nr:hypothetical protein TWF679_010990 [Orbilia oligospora]
MAPRIQAKDLQRQGINIKYEYADDVSALFPNADPKVDEYAGKIDDIMQNTVENLFHVPEDEPFRKGRHSESIHSVAYQGSLLYRPSSAEDHLAGEILSLVAQVSFNFENDPTIVEGDQECFCITLHGQYVHFSTTIIPDKYIKYHNSGKPLKELEEVKVIISPEYDLTKAEDRFHMVWGFVALYMHLNPVSKRQMKMKGILKASTVDVKDKVKDELAQKLRSLDLSK